MDCSLEKELMAALHLAEIIKWDSLHAFCKTDDSARRHYTHAAYWSLAFSHFPAVHTCELPPVRSRRSPLENSSAETIRDQRPGYIYRGKK